MYIYIIYTISYIYIYIYILLQIQLSSLAMSHHVQSADGSGLSSSPPAAATAATAAAPAATEPAEAKAKAQPEVLYTNKRGLTQETCQALWFDGSVGHLWIFGVQNGPGSLDVPWIAPWWRTPHFSTLASCSPMFTISSLHCPFHCKTLAQHIPRFSREMLQTPPT